MDFAGDEEDVVLDGCRINSRGQAGSISDRQDGLGRTMIVVPPAPSLDQLDDLVLNPRDGFGLQAKERRDMSAFSVLLIGSMTGSRTMFAPSLKRKSVQSAS